MTKSNVIDFETYRRKINPTDEELFLDAFGAMTEDEIKNLIDDLCEIFGVEEPANDDKMAFKSIVYFTEEGTEVWESDTFDEDLDLPE